MKNWIHVLFCLLLIGNIAFPANVPDNEITEGKARFQVITPMVIRLEYASDGNFENRPTFFVLDRNPRQVEFETSVSHGWRIIETTEIILKYKQNSGRFSESNLLVQLKSPDDKEVYPIAASGDSLYQSDNLGGWRHDLGFVKGSIDLYDGLLNRNGWYLFDDTKTAVWKGAVDSSWVEPRNTSEEYQDLYFFGYGHQYKDVLQDFADLTGHPPMLPCWAFGIWFSRLENYGADDFRHHILPQMREHRIPLDALIIDTDWKSPDRWDGWNWDPVLFPEPDSFMHWTEKMGLQTALNIHPSIQESDPQFALADSIGNGLLDITGECPRWQRGTEPCAGWDWGVPAHAESYFALHKPFEKQSIDFWWLDWCCDASKVSMPGLTPDTWINSLYTRRMEQQGKRGFSLSRIGSSWQEPMAEKPGSWAEHRYSIHFTGDTYPTWEMLGFQAAFTAGEGNVGMPYISHDIGSFHAGGPRADSLSDDMYIRWIQAGTFQPIFRLHGHGRRLPWMYQGKAREISAKFMRLRHALIPFFYTLARKSHETGLPMVRSMYLEYPQHEEAYTFPNQYLLGENMLVAPIASPGDTASQLVWFPPGVWMHYFTGEIITGPQTLPVTASLETMSVYVKTGSIIPMQPYMDYVGQKPVDPLTIRVFTGSDGTYELYEDAGTGLEYRQGKFAQTKFTYAANSKRAFTIHPPEGKGYSGMPDKRGYEIHFSNLENPGNIKVNGEVFKGKYSYQADSKSLTISLPSMRVSAPVRIVIE